MVLKLLRRLWANFVFKKVSVPLRGYGFEICSSRTVWDHREPVSVPLRGCGFEINFSQRRARNSRAQFPSPCGDVVLKYALRLILWFLFGLKFPSPCGDVVLKLIVFHSERRRVPCSFRPLAGMWFWNHPEDVAEAALLMVSVPLRGCGFEICMNNYQKKSIGECFRPLAGMWFWNCATSRSKIGW